MLQFSPKQYFKEKILPQIRKRLDEVKVEQDKDGYTDLTKYDLLVFESIKKIKEGDKAYYKELHDKLLSGEKMAAITTLLFAYYRGLFYIKFKWAFDKKESENYKKYFSENLGISYEMAQNYMAITLLIKKWPRLILCGLDRAQLSKHMTRLRDYLEQEDDELNEQLGMDVNLKIGVTSFVTIKHNEKVMAPSVGVVNVDPDFLAYGNPANKEEEEEEEDDVFENAIEYFPIDD